MVEVFILLFFVALCCLAVILSVSASGRRSSLPHRSTEQSPPRFIELQYDMLGGRLKRIGNIEIQYDMLGGRPKWLGDIELQYDMLGGRPKWLGDIELQYDMLGGRLKRIGNIEIQYDMLGGRPKWLGDVEIQYDMLGGRPKYIVAMNNNADLTQQNLITIFFVLYERTKKIKAASVITQ
jgi:hypothetical protein